MTKEEMPVELNELGGREDTRTTKRDFRALSSTDIGLVPWNGAAKERESRPDIEESWSWYSKHNTTVLMSIVAIVS